MCVYTYMANLLIMESVFRKYVAFTKHAEQKVACSLATYECVCAAMDKHGVTCSSFSTDRKVYRGV